MSMTFASRPSLGRLLWHRHLPLLSLLFCTPTTEGLLQEKYIGCFYDNNQTTDVLPASFPPDDTLTIEKCVVLCHSLNTTYSALQNGSVCHCRDVYGAQLGQPDSICNLNCSGNKNQICGGLIGQKIVYSLYAVCSIGTYGIACEKGCHCEHDIPCDRTTGHCPDGCYGNWNDSACNTTTASRQYIGCYRDAHLTRALEFRAKNIWRNIIQTCSMACAKNNYSYAGLQFYSECLCGESYDRYGPSTGCNTYCSGDGNIICGGSLVNSVYSVCPNGNYGRSCVGRCRCLNSERCVFRNGSCPSSLCQPGWTGISCDIRDCTKNNGDCNLNERCSSINLKYANVSVCRCENGFKRSRIWDNCEDIDECSLKVCDNDSSTCFNTIGSYNCTCRSGFQGNNATACMDIDECQTNICDNSTTDCNNTHGSYICSCKEGLWKFNDHSCMGERVITAGVVGFIIGVTLSLAVAFAFLLIICRRKFRNRGMTENKPSKSIDLSPESKGDESENFGLHPCKSEVEDSSRSKLNDKVAPFSKGKSVGYENVHVEFRTFAKDEAALNTDSDVNTYESLNVGVSEVDETRIYADLKI